MSYRERFKKLKGLEREVQEAREVKEWKMAENQAAIEKMHEFIKPQVKKVCKDFAKALGWRYGILEGKEIVDGKVQTSITLSHNRMYISICIRQLTPHWLSSIPVPRVNMTVSIGAHISNFGDDSKPTDVSEKDFMFQPESYQKFSKEELAEFLERCHVTLTNYLIRGFREEA